MQILVVDDSAVAREIIRSALTAAGHVVSLASNGQEALEKILNESFRLVISDWEMPGMTGIQLCKAVRAANLQGYVFFILLTSKSGTESTVEGLSAGADEFITKPFHPDELRVRVRTAQRVLALETRELTIFALAKLAESRDPETGEHLERVQNYSRIIACQLATQPKFARAITPSYVQNIYLTSPLHDIGKVAIPDSILLKPGKLTPAEFEIMKTHALAGARTLEDVLTHHPEAEFLVMARNIAASHHEKFDGTGYPNNLKNDEIPLCSRIVALADVYDALTTKRVYKNAFSHDHARSIILEGSGAHFDPDIVDAFKATESQFIAISRTFAEASAMAA
ncbi:MAG TPA: HD domain-containing phosphohydrolase [Tepidisphaeraceae bacterium]|jgi:putative two-component system response regulator|nr:HD domain-containing phosphohydrolase [Tepidisphaeraceae bacterium]